MAASVCMYPMFRPFKPSSSLPLLTELITPAVIVLDRDRGLPRATTNSPGRADAEEPSFITVNVSGPFRHFHIIQVPTDIVGKNVLYDTIRIPASLILPEMIRTHEEDDLRDLAHARGANSYGQLAQGFKSEQCPIPTKVCTDTDPASIVSIVGGGGHTMLLDKHGRLFGCGYNSKGQLGVEGKMEVLSFERVTSLGDYAIESVACSWDSTFAITRCGRFFVWGSNTYGQLGVPKHEITFSPTPIEVPLPTIQHVSSGLRHSAMVTKEGCVIVCGTSRKGALGLIDQTNKPLICVDEPRTGLPNIQKVVCGQHHTIAQSLDGRIFGWGDNKHGQLGLDPSTHPYVYTPLELQQLIAAPDNELVDSDDSSSNVDAMAANPTPRTPWSFLVVFSPAELRPNNGDVMSWGWNEHGNCGTGSLENVTTPAVLDTLKKTSLIGAGAGHSFAVIEPDY
uniref:RCC1-like domain-containing protein n=1 Tax=Timema shepardi TaxID=629360 RepID=A0A7R9AZ24_TIMSH|nr:unnamed protein product [Timema shepardi]